MESYMASQSLIIDGAVTLNDSSIDYNDISLLSSKGMVLVFLLLVIVMICTFKVKLYFTTIFHWIGKCRHCLLRF